MAQDQEDGTIFWRLPVPFQAASPYNSSTNVAVPLAVRFFRTGAFVMLEWETLKWTEHAPFYVDVATVVIALLILTVIESKQWMDFKGRTYFRYSLLGLFTIYIGVIGYAFLTFETHASDLVDPAISKLQSQVASALRERDIAVLERDAARRENGTATPPGTPIPPPSPAKTTDDVEARIDVWKSIDGQMIDLNRFIGEGDNIVENWKTNQASLSPKLADLRSHIAILRERLSQLIAVNSNFSDLKVVDQAILAKLAAVIENSLQASGQLPKEADQNGYETSIGPYIGPLKRQLVAVKQWTEGVKKLSASSISELSAREVSK